jgi:hypothetical protein
MNLNDLLRKHKIDPEQVLVFRHRPKEPELDKALPWLADKKPNWFNAYQQTQGKQVEKAMIKASYIASSIRHGSGKALFIGLYSIGGSKALSVDEFWDIPAHIELKNRFRMKGFHGQKGRSSILCFDLKLTKDFYSSWKGKLIVEWPPPERSWWRRAHRNDICVHSILEDSALNPQKPRWDELTLKLEGI